MNIVQFYTKLNALDLARGRTGTILKDAMTTLTTDIAAVNTVMNRFIDRSYASMVPAQLYALDAAFKAAKSRYSAFAIIDEADQSQKKVKNAEAAFRTKYWPVTSIAEGVTGEETLRTEIAAIEDHLETLRSQRHTAQMALKPITDYNADDANTIKITPENVLEYAGPVEKMRWAFDGAYRRARAAVAGLGLSPSDYVKTAQWLADIEAEIAEKETALAPKKVHAKDMATDLQAYETLKRLEISDATALVKIRDQIGTQLGNAVFIDKFAPLLGDDQAVFLEAAVKRRGLELVYDFAKTTQASLATERARMAIALKKLNHARSRTPGKIIITKFTNAALDQTAAAVNMLGAYYTRNFRLLRNDTVGYHYAGTDLSFKTLLLDYQASVLKTGAADKACSRDVFGMNADNAADFGLQAQDITAIQPDFAATLTDMARKSDNTDMLAALGVDMTDKDARLPDVDIDLAELAQTAEAALVAAMSVRVDIGPSFTADFSGFIPS